MTADVLAELRALHERVGGLEDELSLRRLIASYGPAVDSGDAESTGALWTEEAVYDMDVGRLDGRAAIADMVHGPTHQEIIDGGSAHAVGPPVIRIDGDRATATAYSQLFRADGDGGFYVWRVAANRWEFVRDPGAEHGWRTAGRLTRLLDGRADARGILGRLSGQDGPARPGAPVTGPGPANGTPAPGTVRR